MQIAVRMRNAAAQQLCGERSELNYAALFCPRQIEAAEDATEEHIARAIGRLPKYDFKQITIRVQVRSK